MKRCTARRAVARVSLPAVAACVALAACTGSLFQSKATPHPSICCPLISGPRAGSSFRARPLPRHPRAYRPVAAALRPRSHSPWLWCRGDSADLAVLRPRVRKGLETDRIAVLYPDRRLDYLPMHAGVDRSDVKSCKTS